MSIDSDRLKREFQRKTIFDVINDALIHVNCTQCTADSKTYKFAWYEDEHNNPSDKVAQKIFNLLRAFNYLFVDGNKVTEKIVIDGVEYQLSYLCSTSVSVTPTTKYVSYLEVTVASKYVPRDN